MDENLKKYLKNIDIKYDIYEHPLVFTVEESNKATKHIPGIRTKNLFLKSESQFYLISLPGEKRLNMKELKKNLNAKDLHFASSDELKSELHLKPGSVSIFGMIYAKNTILVIDREIWNSEFSGFHPNINNETIVLSKNNLEKFIISLKCKTLILEL